MTDPLIADLLKATDAAQGKLECSLCDYANTLEEGSALRAVITAAAAGTIGERKLEVVFRKHEIPVGRRAIIRHRKEGHLL